MRKTLRGLNYLILIRITLGCIYLISGMEKLLFPYENFVYIIQEHDIFHNNILVQMIGWAYPWIEFILGGFLVIGLWLNATLKSIGLISILTIIAVAQGIMRNLTISEYSCLGDLIRFSPQTIIAINAAILILICILLYFIKHASLFSFDDYFSK